MKNINEDIPFDFLPRKWVEILKVAFDQMEIHGLKPETYYIYPHYRIDDRAGFPTYQLLFHPHEIDWMNEGGVDVDDHVVVIKADTLEFIKIYQGRN